MKARVILVLSLVAWLAGCGSDRISGSGTLTSPPQGEQEAPSNPTPPAPLPPPPLPLPEEIAMIAEKSYGPSRWIDAVWDAKVEIEREVEFFISIPNELHVTAGNAGNHQSQLFLGEGESQVVCTYRGGADVSRPIAGRNPRQIEKGLKYHLRSCSNGQRKGDLILVKNFVRLTINNGDSSTTTQVRLMLKPIPSPNP